MTNAEMEHTIREHITSEHDRYILYRRLIDGATYERIADEMTEDPDKPVTANSVCKRCLRARDRLAKYIH